MDYVKWTRIPSEDSFHSSKAVYIERTMVENPIESLVYMVKVGHIGSGDIQSKLIPCYNGWSCSSPSIAALALTLSAFSRLYLPMNSASVGYWRVKWRFHTLSPIPVHLQHLSGQYKLDMASTLFFVAVSCFKFSQFIICLEL